MCRWRSAPFRPGVALGGFAGPSAFCILPFDPVRDWRFQTGSSPAWADDFKPRFDGRLGLSLIVCHQA